MPLLPIKMTPAFRHGMDTPWGGNMLAVEFGKQIPDDKTGESLEASVLPGLNSTDENGRPLAELVRELGPRLTGKRIGDTFPLLLKLIDARDRLSVQVHPNDMLAKTMENKSGKSEAWVILRANPGAKIIYGIKKNIPPEIFRSAALDNAAIEQFLQSVPVRAGDIINIPAGTIHATGAGITLYEIQQSSDVTYRLYDWGRSDRHGKARILHTEKALAAADLSVCYSPEKPVILSQDQHGTRMQLLKNEHFTLESWINCSEEPMLPDPERFKIITALSEMDLCNICDNTVIFRVKRGESLILPADGVPAFVNCKEMLIAFPTI